MLCSILFSFLFLLLQDQCASHSIAEQLPSEGTQVCISLGLWFISQILVVTQSVQ